MSLRVRSTSNASSNSKGCVNPAFTPETLSPPNLSVRRQSSVFESSSGDGGASRGQWGGKVDFMLTCIGYAVGLGNVWRFPYLCYKNGGGAFLIPYIIMLLLVGMPMFFFELSLGQFSSLGPISVWSVSPIMKGIGVCMVAISFIVSLYYNVIIAWSFSFLFRSMSSILPWEECDPAWANDMCFNTTTLKNETLKMALMEERNLSTNLSGHLQTPSEQYFYRSVLQMSDDIDDTGVPVWTLVIASLLVWSVVFIVLLKGVSSLGKVMYFVTTFPYVMMLAFVINGCLLEGGGKGIEFYLTPNWGKLADPQVWCDAATQLFFSLSAGTGGLIAMGSFNNFKNNCYRDSLIVPIVNCCTSVFAGFAVFSVLGHMAHVKGVDIADLPNKKKKIVFVVYPEAIVNMPCPTLWAILFFVMLILLGFSSSFSIMETVFVAIMDEFPHVLRATPRRPIIFRAVGCMTMFLLSLPMLQNNGYYVFEIVESFSGSFPLLIIALFEIVTISWIYGMRNFASDIEMMIGHKPNIFFKICWKVLTPAILLVVLVASILTYEDKAVYVRSVIDDLEHDFAGNKENPDPLPSWAMVLGWLVMVFIVIWIPIVALFQLITPAAIKAASVPSQDWHPALEENRQLDTRYINSVSDNTSTNNHTKKNISTISARKPLKINTTPSLLSQESRVAINMNTPPIFPNTPPVFPTVQPMYVINGVHNAAYAQTPTLMVHAPPAQNGISTPPVVIYAPASPLVYSESAPPAYTPPVTNTTL